MLSTYGGVKAAGHLWLSRTSIHISDITRTVGGLCTEPQHTRINNTQKKFSHLRWAIIENHSTDGNKGRRCGKYRFRKKKKPQSYVFDGRGLKGTVCCCFFSQAKAFYEQLTMAINDISSYSKIKTLSQPVWIKPEHIIHPLISTNSFTSSFSKSHYFIHVKFLPSVLLCHTQHQTEIRNKRVRSCRGMKLNEVSCESRHDADSFISKGTSLHLLQQSCNFRRFLATFFSCPGRGVCAAVYLPRKHTCWNSDKILQSTLQTVISASVITEPSVCLLTSQTGMWINNCCVIGWCYSQTWITNNSRRFV